MPSYENNDWWQRTLVARDENRHAAEISRLRVAYLTVRERAKPLAERIATDLPGYTVHDVSHSDALWDYGVLVAGADYPLNPCEAFVLGCSFLLHDLGMGLAAYPEGLPALKASSLWQDTVANILYRSGMDLVNQETIQNPGASVEKQALCLVLRELHGQRADQLGQVYWGSTDNPFYLIEDHNLRAGFGPIIGRIAASHSWPVERIATEFPMPQGALAEFPKEWTVDALKLACILRCADACHIDEGRAPGFLHAMREPRGESNDHWVFQQKLCQPQLQNDRLVFTAKNTFSMEEAPAWWLCYDTLKAIDNELRRVDALLVDTKHTPFLARGVSQAGDPARMANLIKPDCWRPVDARLRVSSVADLVAKLGGKDLYGDTVRPPLREMIQNAADAVRARRLLEKRAGDWGEIRVTSGRDDFGEWIQVEDTGIGMSETVLTGTLLDFGESFWGSPLMNEQIPGLAATGFRATGMYGIGFFSVFMWGSRVDVVTQRYDEAPSSTRVLSFQNGLNVRPLLREAKPAEHIRDGGTRVKVWLSDDLTMKRLKRIEHPYLEPLTLSQCCAGLAPCLDVTLKAEGEGGIPECAVRANDWLIITDEDLLLRVAAHSDVPTEERNSTCPPLRVLKLSDGRPVGRAAVWDYFSGWAERGRGVVTVGGLQASYLGGIIGVLFGRSQSAARDLALPLVPVPILQEWAEQERDARCREGLKPEALASLGQVIARLGVEVSGIPIALTNEGWVASAQVEHMAKTRDEVLLIDMFHYKHAGGDAAQLVLHDAVLAVDDNTPSIVSSPGGYSTWPLMDNVTEWKHHYTSQYSFPGTVIRSLAKGWKCSLDDVLEASTLRADEDATEREIGTLLEKPYSRHVEAIIRRPSKLRKATKRRNETKE